MTFFHSRTKHGIHNTIHPKHIFDPNVIKFCEPGLVYPQDVPGSHLALFVQTFALAAKLKSAQSSDWPNLNGTFNIFEAMSNNSVNNPLLQIGSSDKACPTSSLLNEVSKFRSSSLVSPCVTSQKMFPTYPYPFRSGVFVPEINLLRNIAENLDRFTNVHNKILPIDNTFKNKHSSDATVPQNELLLDRNVFFGFNEHPKQNNPTEYVRVRHNKTNLVKVIDGTCKHIDQLNLGDFIDSALCLADQQASFTPQSWSSTLLPNTELRWVHLLAIKDQIGSFAKLIFEKPSKSHGLKLDGQFTERNDQAIRMLKPNFSTKKFRPSRKLMFTANRSQLFYVYRSGWSAIDAEACRKEWNFNARLLKVNDICLVLVHNASPQFTASKSSCRIKRHHDSSKCTPTEYKQNLENDLMDCDKEQSKHDAQSQSGVKELCYQPVSSMSSVDYSAQVANQFNIRQLNVDISTQSQKSLCFMASHLAKSGRRSCD